MKVLNLLILLGGLLLCLPSMADAQVYRPPVAPRRPPVSPYLDLLRGPGPTFNYYRRIRPELEMRRQLQLNQLQLQQLQTQVELQSERLNRLLGGSTRFGSITLPIPYGPGGAGQLGVTGVGQGLPPTGHPTAFGDLGGYFPGLGGSAGLSGGVRAPATTAARPALARPARPSPPRPATTR